MQIRGATAEDTDACLELLMRVREHDGYPLHATPDEARSFFLAGRGLGSWVAVEAGAVVGQRRITLRRERPHGHHGATGTTSSR